MTLSDSRSISRDSLHTTLPMPWATLVGFILAILAMLLIGIVTYLSLQSRSESRERVAHTIDVVSGLERLQARIVAAERHDDVQVMAVVALGEDGQGARMLARVTRKSWDALGLAPGQDVFAQIKGVALVQDSV